MSDPGTLNVVLKPETARLLDRLCLQLRQDRGPIVLRALQMLAEQTRQTQLTCLECRMREQERRSRQRETI